MRITMRHTLLAGACLAGAMSGLSLLDSAPAAAACNPGSPHCVMVGQGSRLAQLKARLNNPGTLGSGDQQCVNSRLCGIDTGDGTSPGALTGMQTRRR